MISALPAGAVRLIVAEQGACPVPVPSGSAGPAGSEAQDLARPRGAAPGGVHGVDDEIGVLVDVRPVDRPVSRDDDDHVGPVHERGEIHAVARRPGGIDVTGDVGIVEADVPAALGEPGDDLGRGRVAGVLDVRLERDAEDADLAPLSARPRSLRASATRSTTWRGIARLMSPASSMNRSTKSNSRARHDR